MNIGSTLYVRTDYKVEGSKVSNEDFNDHLKYLESIATERFFMGGGFINEPGGMIVFEAKDIVEAHKISKEDPLIAKGLYNYKLVEWEMIILSKDL